MKPKIIILFFILLFFNSCIVKSLHPFYTQNNIYFEKRFLGVWEDEHHNKCEVISFEKAFFDDKMKEAKKLGSVFSIVDIKNNMNKSDTDILNKYKDAYYVKMTDNNKEATFIAMPFRLNDQIFLDFSLLEVNMDPINSLANYHLIGTHSLIKLEFAKDYSMINLKFFDEEKLNELIDQHKIHIKYEKFGFDESQYLLTASSEELQKFIKKYMNSNDEKKWSSEIQYNFKK